MGNNYLEEPMICAALKQLELTALELAEYASAVRQRHMNCLETLGADEFQGSLHTLSESAEIRRGEQLIYKCCLLLSSIYRDSDVKPMGEMGRADGRLISLWQGEEEIILKAPYLRKAANGIDPQPWKCLVYSTLCYLDTSRFTAKQIVLYALSVYPSNTPTHIVCDADNVDIKSLGDPLTEKLGIDDNALDVFVISGAVISDKIQPGTFLIAKPNNGKFEALEDLKNELENVRFSTDF